MSLAISLVLTCEPELPTGDSLSLRSTFNLSCCDHIRNTILQRSWLPNLEFQSLLLEFLVSRRRLGYCVEVTLHLLRHTHVKARHIREAGYA